MYTLTLAQIVGWVMALFGSGVCVGIEASEACAPWWVLSVFATLAILGIGLLIGSAWR